MAKNGHVDCSSSIHMSQFYHAVHGESRGLSLKAGRPGINNCSNCIHDRSFFFNIELALWAPPSILFSLCASLNIFAEGIEETAVTCSHSSYY